MDIIEEINSLLVEYFQFKEAHSPYLGREWKTNGPLAIQCKSILDRLARELDKFIQNRNLAKETYHIRVSSGAAYYPRTPWIGVFFGGEEPTDGIYPVVSFFENNSGFYIACVESIAKPQPGFSKELCDLRRQTLADVEYDRDLFEDELGDVEHVAFPAAVFGRQEKISTSHLEGALINAFRLYRQYRNDHKRNASSISPVTQSTFPGAPQTVGELFAQFETVKKSIDELSMRLDKESHRVLAYVEDVKKQASVLEVQVAKERDRAATETDKIANETGLRIQNFISSYQTKLSKLQNDASDLLTAATAGALGVHFDEKEKSAGRSFGWRFVFFVICLCGLAGVGLWAISTNGLQGLANGASRVDVLRLVALSVMKFAAFYIPLLWLTCHMNRSTVQAKRLKEEYAHKGVVAKTYVGLSKQIDELVAKNVDSAKSLSVELLSATIKVLSANPNYVFDKAKTSMPLSIFAEDVSKVATAASKLVKKE